MIAKSNRINANLGKGKNTFLKIKKSLHAVNHFVIYCFPIINVRNYNEKMNAISIYGKKHFREIIIEDNKLLLWGKSVDFIKNRIKIIAKITAQF